LLGGASVAGLSALTQLLFVMTKLPTIFWSDLLGGIFAAALAAFSIHPSSQAPAGGVTTSSVQEACCR
jgi:hypothetical protein